MGTHNIGVYIEELVNLSYKDCDELQKRVSEVRDQIKKNRSKYYLAPTHDGSANIANAIRVVDSFSPLIFDLLKHLILINQGLEELYSEAEDGEGEAA